MLGKSKCHRSYHWSQDPSTPQQLPSSSFSTTMLWQPGSFQTEPQHTCKSPETAHTRAESICKEWWCQGMPRLHLPTLFLKELGSQERGKETFLKDLRDGQNNLSALFSPLIPKKCQPAYIVKRQFGFLVKLYFSKKRKHNSIYDSEHQERICDKRNSEVFNSPR